MHTVHSKCTTLTLEKDLCRRKKYTKATHIEYLNEIKKTDIKAIKSALSFPCQIPSPHCLMVDEYLNHGGFAFTFRNLVNLTITFLISFFLPPAFIHFNLLAVGTSVSEGKL